MSLRGVALSPLMFFRQLSDHFTRPQKSLRHEFNMVINLIKRSSRPDGKNNSPSPTWYLISGQVKSGRRTLLKHSDFDHIYPSALVQRSSHRTQYSQHEHDWYISQDTVLLSIPSFDENDGSQTENRQLLNMLPALQNQCQLGGLIVTVSADELLQSTPENLQGIRNRFQQLQREFSPLCTQVLPVYVIVTKCDLVLGFSEFFAACGLEKKRRVFGISCREQSPSGSLADSIDTLCQGLHQQLQEFLQTEQNMLARRRMAGFPWHFERMRPALSSLCCEFSSPRHVDAGMLLRGIYFTSAIITTDSAGVGNTCFIQSAFEDLRTDEKMQVTSDASTVALSSTRMNALPGMAFVFLISIATWIYASYSLHQNIGEASALLNGAQASIDEMDHYKSPKTNTGLRDSLEFLSRLSSARMLFQKELSPSISAMGMYDTTPQNKLDDIYHETLREQWLTALIRHTTSWANDNSLSYHERFDSVKACLMLLQPKRRKPDFLHAWISTSAAFSGLETKHKKLLLQYLQDYLKLKNSSHFSHENSMLIAQQQENLRAQSPAERIYSSFLTRYQGKYLDLKNHLGVSGSEIIHSKSADDLRIPVIFTAAVYEPLNFSSLAADFIQSRQDAWVLGAGENLSSNVIKDTDGELKQRYMRDYAAAWSDLYKRISLRRPTDSNELTHMLKALSSPTESPLNRLFTITRDNTPEATEFNRYFQPVSETAQNRLSLALSALLEASAENLLSGNTGGPSHTAQKERMTTASHSLNRVIGELPAPVSVWITQLKNVSFQMQHAQNNDALRNTWRKQVYAPCTALLAGRYPISGDTNMDISYDDFVAYFKPGGIEDAFVRQHLPFFWDRNTGTTDTSANFKPSTKALTMLRQGQRIRQAFFNRNASKASFDFRVRPESMHAKLSQYSFHGTTNSFVYGHGPRVESRFSWPQSVDSLQTAFTTLDGKTFQDEFSGDWALFHWLDAASARQFTKNNLLKLDQRHDTHSIHLQLTTTQPVNPLDRTLLTQYQCVAQL